MAGGETTCVDNQLPQQGVIERRVLPRARLHGGEELPHELDHVPVLSDDSDEYGVDVEEALLDEALHARHEGLDRIAVRWGAQQGVDGPLGPLGRAPHQRREQGADVGDRLAKVVVLVRPEEALRALATAIRIEWLLPCMISTLFTQLRKVGGHCARALARLCSVG